MAPRVLTRVPQFMITGRVLESIRNNLRKDFQSEKPFRLVHGNIQLLYTFPDPSSAVVSHVRHDSYVSESTV